MKLLKKILKAFLYVALLAATCLIAIILYALISDYRPEEKIKLSENASPSIIADTSELTILTWNIGYCGLDRDMDFFYDGGRKVFTSLERCKRNLEAVEQFIRKNDSCDFIFIQEIDKKSKRSYRFNEYDSLEKTLKDYYPSFALNYDVFFVPVPPSSPMGKVLSGLATFSKFIPSLSERYSFPGAYGFPKQLFMLDRCFLVNRYPLAGNHELVVINTHNEAFDKGNIRRAQMAYLRDYIRDEYNKGNYVITGGDWNQTPPEFRTAFHNNVADTSSMVIPSDFMPPGWNWVFDNTEPSERSVVTAYNPETTPTTIFDFFLVSPNVNAVKVRCINLHFKNSDHNPVIIKVKLNRAGINNPT